MNPGEWAAAYREALAGLPVRILDLSLELEARFPLEFPGAFLRGVLGNRLRAGCRSRRTGDRCPAGTCPWCDLFDAEPSGQAADHWSGDLRTIPVPYAVQVTPPEWSRGRLRVLLVGPAARHAEAVVEALREAGARGLGRERVRALVVDVEDRQASAAERTASVMAAGGSERLVLEAVSPLRLKCGGRWCRELAPRALVVAAARRASALVFHHGSGEALPAPPRPWLEELAERSPAAADWRWVHLERWSARQRRRYPAGGLVGRADLRDLDEPAAFLLAVGAVLGVGKGIAYGLGRYRLLPGAASPGLP